MQRVVFSDRVIQNENERLRLTEDKFVKIAMWFPSILTRAITAQEINL